MRVDSLRGARIYLFIIAIISLSIFVSLFHSRPAHAEDFLRKTVRCVVGVLFSEDCQKTVPAPSDSAAASEPTTSPGASNSNKSALVTPQQSVVVPNQSLSQVAPVAPINAELAPVSELADWSEVAHNNETILANSLPYGFAYNIGEGVSSRSGPLEPTSEGWRVFGVLWYWWAAGGAAIVATGLLLKRRLASKALTSP